MKTKYCLLVLFLTVFISTNTAQTIRLLGTLNGPKSHFNLKSDGTDFGILNTLPNASTLERSLLEASDKLIYGASSSGGANGDGFIYRMYADGRNYEVLHEFDGLVDSRFPNGDLIEGSDGKIYGTAASDYQAAGDTQSGTIFRMDKDGANFEVLHYLNQTNGDGGWLNTGLIEASDGMLYGVTESFGANGRGTLFRVAKDGSGFTVVYDFNTFRGTSAQLVENGGKLYGINDFGGGFGAGAIYSYDLTLGTVAGLGGIPAAQGSNTGRTLIFSNGFIYAFTNSGGANGEGTIFKFEVATGSYTTLHTFTAAQSGDKTLAIGSNGKLYGTIQGGGTGIGSVFEITTTGTFTEFYSAVAPNGQPRGTLLEIINTPPTLIMPVANVAVMEDNASYSLDLSTIFTASDEPLQNLEVSISNISNPALFSTSSLVNGILNLDAASENFGFSTVTLRALDSRGDFTETTFDFDVSPVADEPAITAASTTYRSFNASGLVVSKNAADGAEVTHFKVTNIIGGKLYLNDEVTAVNEGDFVTFAEGALGLKFFSTAAGAGSFDIQASTSNMDAGLGGNVVTSAVTSSKAPLTVTAENIARVYGATDPAFTLTYSGFLGSDGAGDIDVIPTISTVATASSDVGAYAIQASGGTDDNYEFNFVDGSLTINKADLQVIADDKNLLYGDSSLPILTFSYAGFVNSDDATDIDVEPSGVTTVADINSPRGSYAIKTNNDGSDNNYNLTYVDGTLTVGKAILTVIAENQSKTYGAANPSLAFTYSGFVNSEDETVLSTIPSISVSADANTEVGSYDITLANGQANNYEFVYQNAVLTISKANLTVSVANESFTYGDSSFPPFDISYAGFVNGENQAVIDTAPTGASTTATLSSDAGSYPIEINEDASDGNYDFAYEDGVLTINPAPLTIIAEDASKVYGEVNPSLALTYVGFVNGDLESDLDTPPMVETTADQSSDAGVYAITGTGGDDINYAITYTDGELTISKAVLQIIADDKSFLYGDASFPLLTYGYLGFVNGDALDVIDVEPSGLTTTGDISSPRGNYDITVNPDGSDNNYIFTYVNGTLTIGKALLTVTAQDLTKTYGASNPELVFDYAGFVNNEDATALSTLPTVSVTADQSSEVGSYPITLAGGTADNYDFTYVNGSLMVEKANLDLTAQDAVMTYGDTSFPSLAFAYSGFVNGEDEMVLDTPPSGVSTDAMVSSDAGSYLTMVSQDAIDNNYSFTYLDGDLLINPAQLEVTVGNATKIYGDANPSFELSYAGLVNGDLEQDLETVPSVSTSADVLSSAGIYDIVVSGGGDNNYDFSYVSGELLITKATLTATADDKEINAGESLPELTATYSGFRNGDDAAGIDTPPNITTTANSTSAAGTFPITMDGGEDDNYELTLINGTLTIEEVLGFENDPSIQIYPNPVSDKIVVNGDQVASIQLMDLGGKTVLSISQKQLDLSPLSSGTYLIVAKDKAGQVLVKKRIIKN